MAMAVDPLCGVSESRFPARLTGLARPDHDVRHDVIAQA
jgi:hypothetical protein